MNDIDLCDLEAFAEVARCRSFRRAATQLRISASSLSERLKAMEDRLGARLLNRTTRSVAPTEAGERLLQRLAPALAEIAGAVTDVRAQQGKVSGRLRINAPPPAIHLVLAPMVAPFLSEYPDIDLEIVADPLRVDIVAGGFDAGVRYEEHLAQDMIAVSLGGRQSYAVVAAPACLSRHGTPNEPADLIGKPMISTRFANGVHMGWEFEKHGRVVTIRSNGPFHSTDIPVQLRAAIDGLGFLATFEGYVCEAIAEGRLVKVLEDWCQSFPGPFLYYPSRRQQPAALQAFVDFVSAWKRSG